MRNPIIAVLAVTVLIVSFMPGLSQPPGGKDKGAIKGKKGPPPFEMGRVLPPFLRQSLDLTNDQEKALNDLEKDVRLKLQKILTPRQLERLKELKGPKVGLPKDSRPKAKGPPSLSQALPPANSIQWFATWKTGLAEAQRTGKPILLVSAAPHCAGVSGIW